jgi:hypothetical protein
MKNFKNVEFIIYDGLVLFYEHCFYFNIFEKVMDKYFKRKSELELPPSTKRVDNSSSEPSTKRVDNSSSKQDRVEINLADLSSDPGLQPRITDYHPNDRDQDRKAYAQKGARQPKEHIFPYKIYGAKDRRFNNGWFTQFSWLEYSIAKDAAFCLCCYLFKSDIGEQAGGDKFVSEGFSNWKCPKKLKIHEGESIVLTAKLVECVMIY